MRARERRPTSHEGRVFRLALLAGLPAALLCALLLALGPYSNHLRVTLGLVVVGFWWGCALAARETVVHPLRTLGNLLAAIRERDFTFGARARRRDALGEVWAEVNQLMATLKEQRFEAIESAALLQKIMEEIDVAVFAFDDDRRLSLLNRAGEGLLDRSASSALSRSPEELGLAPALVSPSHVVELGLPGRTARFEVRRSRFRQHGRAMELLVLSDVGRVLRDEERQAWQRLIRVLGHELNNSLAPIHSIAGSLQDRLRQEPLPEDWKDDARRGLAVIASRSEALRRFLEASSRLARLPPPQMRPVNVGELLRRVAALETRVPVTVARGEDVTLDADPDQLEQALINLLRNAAEASLVTGGTVGAGWTLTTAPAPRLTLWIDDEGPGLPPTSNLFVPFFTTKPQGTGLGLVLSRQILEAHGGELTLQNRPGGRGCRALVSLQAG